LVNFLALIETCSKTALLNYLQVSFFFFFPEPQFPSSDADSFLGGVWCQYLLIYFLKRKTIVNYSILFSDMRAHKHTQKKKKNNIISLLGRDAGHCCCLSFTCTQQHQAILNHIQILWFSSLFQFPVFFMLSIFLFAGQLPFAPSFVFFWATKHHFFLAAICFYCILHPQGFFNCILSSVFRPNQLDMLNS